MRIALINENSQKQKNTFIYKILCKVASKYGHEVFNYGVSEGKKASIDYVGAGVLAGILLNSHAVDFVIMGCGSGQGAMISANTMANVFCGYVADIVDANLFVKINAGNAVSIPFGKNFGVGTDINLENIFDVLLKEEMGSGYPRARKEIQDEQRKNLSIVSELSKIPVLDFLEEIDKEFLCSVIRNDYFEENFFKYCEDDFMREYLKSIIDA